MRGLALGYQTNRFYKVEGPGVELTSDGCSGQPGSKLIAQCHLAETVAVSGLYFRWLHAAKGYEDHRNTSQHLYEW